VRDYRDEYRDSSKTLGSASPFNVTKSSMTLRNFTRGEIAELYAQHTQETGQAFEPGAVERAWELTQGQPWLVNALARTAINLETEARRSAASGDAAGQGGTLGKASAARQAASEPALDWEVTAVMIEEAKQAIILRRDTHIDSFMARLTEPRVRKVVGPMLTGDFLKESRFSDDYQYVKDLGLIRDDQGRLEPANPIYAELIARTLSFDSQQDIEESRPEFHLPRYARAGGRIDMDLLLADFCAFWRENSDAWAQRYDYQEAAPQLTLQAFLQRVLNGGGSIAREYAAGSGRVDICVAYAGHKYPIELKIRYAEDRYGGRTYADSLAQVAAYMDRMGCALGWLMLFDRRPEVSWEDKLYARTEAVGNKSIHVLGC